MRIESSPGHRTDLPEDLGAAVAYGRDPVGASVRLHAVGDVGFCGRLDRPLAPTLDADPWSDVAPVLRSGDASFANLETPLVPPGADRSEFVGRTPAAVTLASAFDLVSVANNHVADAGQQGISSTLGALEDAGVTAVGAGADSAAARNLVCTRLGDLNLGWLACARTLQPQADSGPAFWELDREEMLETVRRHRAEGTVDVLVVSIHWGYMFIEYPDPEHRRLTHELAAAGADLVVCHHAHVLQGIEVVPGWQGRTAGICHNLGNFLFDWAVGKIRVDDWIEEQRTGVVVAADFDREGLCRLAALPTRIEEEAGGLAVRWATGEAGRSVLERLARISSDLAGDYEPLFRRQRAERNTSLVLRGIAGCLRRGEWRPVLGLLPRLRPRHLGLLFRRLGQTLR